MALATLDSPYKGLVPYAEEDADLFFGREAEREIIAANLLANRLTLLYGPSGVGKSSVLQAGVVHDLRAQARDRIARHRHVDAVPVVVRSWADDPAVALLAETRRALRDLLGDRATDLPVPRDRLSATLEAWTEALDVELLLVLDQFEEYFTYGLGGGRHLFADEIAQLVGAPQLHVRVLISIREDALARLDAFKGRIPGLFDNYLRIEHLTLDAARAAIVRPVERFDELTGVPAAERRSVDPDLVEAVIAQVRSGEVGLGRAPGGSPSGHGAGGHVETPYLQLVMDRLWRTEAERGSRVLRRASLFQIGGAEEIVRTHVASAMSALDAADQDIAAAAFHYLVTPSGLKMAHSADDLAGYTGAPADRLAPLLERLCSSPIRILRPQPVPDRPDAPPRWEIVHDVLAQAVLEWGREREHEREAAERAERAREEERVRHRRRIVRIRRLAIGAGLLALVPIGLQEDAKSDAQDERSKAVKRAVEAELNGVRSSIIRSGSRIYQVSLPEAWRREKPRTDGPSAIFVARDAGRLEIIGHEGVAQSERRFDREQDDLKADADRARTGLVTSIAGKPFPWAEFRVGDEAHVLIRRGTFVLHGRGRTAALVHSITNFAASSIESLTGQLVLTAKPERSRGSAWRATGRLLNGGDYGFRVEAVLLEYKDRKGRTRQRPVARRDTECPDALVPHGQCSIELSGTRGRARKLLTLVVRGATRTTYGVLRIRKRVHLVIGPTPTATGASKAVDAVVSAQAPEDAGSTPVPRGRQPGSGTRGQESPQAPQGSTTGTEEEREQQQPSAPDPAQQTVAPPTDETEVVPEPPTDEPATPQDEEAAE